MEETCKARRRTEFSQAKRYMSSLEKVFSFYNGSLKCQNFIYNGYFSIVRKLSEIIDSIYRTEFEGVKCNSLFYYKPIVQYPTKFYICYNFWLPSKVIN